MTEVGLYGKIGVKGVCKIKKAEAEALLAGIMLDTKSFSMRAGVRTFEAAAYLRSLGADTVSVKQLFANSMKTQQAKSEVVKNAAMYTDCAIGVVDFESDDVRIVASQAADELLNIDDDVVDGKILENTGRFKSIISGNIISVRQIYREVMDFIPYITCIFSCNKLPRIMDKTSGLYRRMVLIELNNKVKNPDPLFMNKVTELDMEYFLFKAVEGIKLAIEEGRFRVTQSESQLLQIFKRRQSPLNEWLYEHEITLGDLHNKKCITLYAQFTEWHNLNGYTKPMSNFTFKEDICALYDLELRLDTSHGTPIQVFYRRGSFDENYKPF